MAFLRGEPCVCGDRVEQAGGQWGVTPLEELQEDEADRLALGE